MRRGAPDNWRIGMQWARGVRQRRQGQVMVETLFPLMMIFGVMFASIVLFIAFLNMLLAQHALTETALYVGSTGVWTKAAETRCLQMLPSAGHSTKSCRVLRVNDDGSAGIPLTMACGGIAVLADCLNLRANNQSFVSYNKPVRIEISYTQPFLALCMPWDKNTCFGATPSSVTRSIDVYSQTRRDPS